MAAIRVFRSVRRKTAALMFLPQVIDSDNLVAATENPGLEFHVPQEDSVTEENIETERFNLYARHTFDVGLFKLTMPSLPEIIEGEFSYNDFLYLSHLLLGEYARAQDRRLLQRLPPRLKFEDGSLVPIYEGEWFDEYRKEHPEGCQFEHPKWDSKNHRLWYKGREARIVAKQAHRVREILDAFEAHRWISPIKFPRRNRFDNEPAAILKAVNQLNDDLRYLVFKATSSSEVISWSPRENSEELLKNSL